MGERLERIKASLAATTPGFWNEYILAPESDEEERSIVITDDGETEICGVCPNRKDAEFIANAKADIEWLIKQYEILLQWLPVELAEYEDDLVQHMPICDRVTVGRERIKAYEG